MLGITHAQVRKDLANLGHLGQPGIGYPTHELVGPVAGSASTGVGRRCRRRRQPGERPLLRHRGFRDQGFRFAALFDADARKVGQRAEGLEIMAMERLSEIVRTTGANLGLVAVPAEAAQGVADVFGGGGGRGF